LDAPSGLTFEGVVNDSPSTTVLQNGTAFPRITRLFPKRRRSGSCAAALLLVAACAADHHGNPLPDESKIGSSLRYLLSIRADSRAPAGLEEILSQDTVAVNVTFKRELRVEELRAFERLGVRFDTVDGDIAHVGAVYGARVPWGSLGALAEAEQVAVIESQWSPWSIPPAHP
jgi:hypothetical protein